MKFNNYVHLDRILEKLNSVHIPGTYWTLDEIKEWTYDALSKISEKDSNIYVSKELDIINNKVKIPTEVEFLDKVIVGNNDLQQLDEGEGILDERHFFINYGYIYLSTNESKVTLYYYTTPVAEDGTPLIPDNKYYISSIIAYLRYKIGERAFWQKKILLQQFQLLEQEWYFYIKATQSNNKRQFLKDPRRFRKIAKRFY